jgi:hypothetical protein
MTKVVLQYKEIYSLRFVIKMKHIWICLQEVETIFPSPRKKRDKLLKFSFTLGFPNSKR